MLKFLAPQLSLALPFLTLPTSSPYNLVFLPKYYPSGMQKFFVWTPCVNRQPQVFLSHASLWIYRGSFSTTRASWGVLRLNMIADFSILMHWPEKFSYKTSIFRSSPASYLFALMSRIESSAKKRWVAHGVVGHMQSPLKVPLRFASWSIQHMHITNKYGDSGFPHRKTRAGKNGSITSPLSLIW